MDVTLGWMFVMHRSFVTHDQTQKSQHKKQDHGQTYRSFVTLGWMFVTHDQTQMHEQPYIHPKVTNVVILTTS